MNGSARPRPSGGGEPRSITEHDIKSEVVISGCAAGLPGTEKLFAEETMEWLMEGRNFIEPLSDKIRESMSNKGVTRIQKHADGGGELMEITDPEQVLKLGGQCGEFDLAEWGVPKRLIDTLDRTSQLAMAAGFEALRDAGLPLIPRYRETRSGKKVTIGWTLPDEVGAETGVIFASAFAGEDAVIDELMASREEDYQFDHRFLLKILGIANSRFAEFVGARGPNTKMNNACASTTAAVGIAEDWIRLGRCKRVIILSADDPTEETMMEWLGSGFLAAGAATTEGELEKAALPFDRRRHGMIVGMGALGLVVEKSGLAESRGLEPYADVLATHFVNSAFHPTRLDVDHIAGEVSTLIETAETRFEIDRAEIADKTVFISHETYTPARGGSAAAEIAALRNTFGDHANDVVIANTKGFTGHSMAAGIEDVLAMKVLQHETVPPIANLEQPDPDLGDLRLSKGGDYDVDYALRLAAGFGSQLALCLFRFRARGEERIFDAAAYGDWLADVSGFEYPALSVEDRVLRLRRGQPEDRPPEGGVRPEKVQPNPFAFQPVAVRAKSAASGDIRALRERLNGCSVAVVGDDQNFADWMGDTVEACGGQVLRIDSSRSELFDEASIVAKFDRFGGVDGVINLLGIDAEQSTADDVYMAARQTFHLSRAFASHHGDELADEHFFLSVTNRGGTLGFGENSVPGPAAGAIGGFTKALSHEWKEADVRVVDVAGEGLYPELARQVLGEVFSDADSPEVGVLGGVRYEPVFYDEAKTSEPAGFSPTSEDLIVVTGGAKGISAEICVDLAQRFGCKLALVGRSELSHSDPLAVDMEAEKERVRQQLAERGERVTPVKVRDAMWSLKSQRTIATNMQRMRKAGSDVEYFSCDVADAASVQQLFEEVRREMGDITGVIHGAGVEESKYLVEKDVAGFDKVFRGKALGGMHLWDAASLSDLDFFVAFSSVAGRFGNEAQTDYSAANETLAALVATINATTDVRALTIDWTAWGEVGMAVEGSMQTILEARGVEFLPPEIGAAMVGDAIENGLSGEMMVAGELGEMGGDLVVEAPQICDIDAADPQQLALLDKIVERGDGFVVVERIFDPEHDLFVDDHVYEGTAILPGVMGYELMAQAAQVLTGRQISEVRDARFERAIKLHRGEPVRLTVTAREVSRQGATIGVETVVESHRVSKTGRALQKEHFSAFLECGDPDQKTVKSFAIDDDVDLRRGPDRGEIYRRFFHTGSFQVLERVPLIADDFVVGYGRVPGQRLVDTTRSGGFISDPLVREMALQTVGLWGMVEKGLSYLPLGIARSVQFRRTRPGEEVCIRCRRRDDASQHAIAFDVEILDADGEVLHWLEKVELIGHQKLRDDAKFGEFAPLHHLSERLSEPEAQALLVERQIDAEEMLSAEETQAYERLRSSARRDEWLASRVAARRAVSRYFRDFFGKSVALDDIFVTKMPSGKPEAVVESDDFEVSILPLPDLTLTHSAGIAIASVTLPGRQEEIGVDLERVEARPENFVESYFTDDEQRLVWPSPEHSDAEQQTLLWTIKESVAKALGLGLELSTHEICVVDFQRRDDEKLQPVVDLRGRALKAVREAGGGDITIEVEVIGGFALATARLDRSAATPRRWSDADMSNGRVATNGHAKANGHANGHTNGRAATNGHANGHAGTNGHVETNGRAEANGRAGTNGHARRSQCDRAAKDAVTELLGHHGTGRDGNLGSWTF